MSPAVPRAAITQDWLAAEAGSERVTLELSRLLPRAPIYTTFFDRTIFGGAFDPARVRTWPLQRLLGPTRHFRSLLPLYPAWFSLVDLRAYDLVLSSSVAFSHAVRTAPNAIHIAYIHAPMRYGWDLDSYLAGSSWSAPTRLVARSMAGPLRRWSRATAARPDVLVANSRSVLDQIKARWGRDAELIQPPVDVDEIAVSERDDGYLLVAARMLAYRRIDLAVAASSRLGRELVVVGDGPERARLESMAGPSVRFLGRVDRAELLDLFARCHAYLVPGIEDFGMAPVEAMAAGKPVIAHAAGGALETVVDGETGVFFDRQTPEALVDAIERLDALTFDPAVIRRNAERFSPPVFRRRFVELFQRLGVDPSLYRADLA